MKNIKTLSIITLAYLLSSCGDENNAKKNSYSFDESLIKVTYLNGETANFKILNSETTVTDSTIFYFNEQKIATKKGLENFQIPIENEKLGYKNIKALIYAKGQVFEINKRIEIVSNINPKLISYKIVNTYPHNTKSYTQGLEFHRDTLFEGTGQRGLSKLLKTNAKTGEIYSSVALPGKYFGEGITILNNKVYQLSWQENTGFIYNADNLKLIKEFNYFKAIEGWGLCNDGKNLYQSDGTEKIWILDPETLKEIGSINVYSAATKIKAVNELEWVDGMIYGNVYQKDALAKINPKTGAVEGIIDLSALKTQVNVSDPGNEVLNGIAYNQKSKTFFITGKNWDKMFEIKLSE